MTVKPAAVVLGAPVRVESELTAAKPSIDPSSGRPLRVVVVAPNKVLLAVPVRLTPEPVP